MLDPSFRSHGHTVSILVCVSLWIRNASIRIHLPIGPGLVTHTTLSAFSEFGLETRHRNAWLLHEFNSSRWHSCCEFGRAAGTLSTQGTPDNSGSVAKVSKRRDPVGESSETSDGSRHAMRRITERHNTTLCISKSRNAGNSEVGFVRESY